MPSSVRKRAGRRMGLLQFLALLVSLAIVGSILGLLTAGLAVPAVGAAGAAVRALPETFNEMPSELEVPKPSEGSRMLDADGRVLAQFFTERRTLVTSEQIAPVMKEAIIAVEDWRFMSHHGVDPDGIMRAAVSNFSGGSTQGASTITQQYVKNILVDKGIQAGDQEMIDSAQEESVERKLREARYALSLEAQMSKDEILTGYLNLATFGVNIYGVEAASRAYFSKSASELTIPEAALLAGAVQSPSLYDPLVNPEESQERRDVVLAKMYEHDYITRSEMNEAKAIPVEEMLDPDTVVSGCSKAGSSAYFCEYALSRFLEDPAFGAERSDRERLLNTGGLTIRTTLQRSKQSAAYKAVTDRVPVQDPSGVNTVLVSLVPQTGEIVAMAQNTPYGLATDENPRATPVNYSVDEAHGGGTGFQPGSTFKMFTLVEWFRAGHSAYEQVGRGNRTYPNGAFKCGGSPIATDSWTVGDLPGKNGTFDVIGATSQSVNQAFADMATQVDFCEIFARAEAMGVVDATTGERIDAYPSNIIGTASVTPLAMASAYGTLANDGTRCEPQPLMEVEASNGTLIKTYLPVCQPAIDPVVARQVSTVLEKTAATYPYKLDRPFAAKSGTTDFNDNTWMVGFVPQLAAAGWAGYAASSSTPVRDVVIDGVFYANVYGGTFIGPMWTQYMTQALEGTPVEPIPEVFIGNKPLPKPKPVEPAAPEASAGEDNAAPGQDSSD